MLYGLTFRHVRCHLSLGKVLSELEAQRARIDRAIAALQRIRDGRKGPAPRPKTRGRSRHRVASKRRAAQRGNPAKLGAVIKFTGPFNVASTAGGHSAIR